MGKLIEIYEELIELNSDEQKDMAEILKLKFISEMHSINPEKVKQFQWKIENIIRKYKNNTSRNNKLLSLLTDKFKELNDILNKHTQ